MFIKPSYNTDFLSSQIMIPDFLKIKDLGSHWKIQSCHWIWYIGTQRTTQGHSSFPTRLCIWNCYERYLQMQRSITAGCLKIIEVFKIMIRGIRYNYTWRASRDMETWFICLVQLIHMKQATQVLRGRKQEGFPQNTQQLQHLKIWFSVCSLQAADRDLLKLHRTGKKYLESGILHWSTKQRECE